MSNATQRHYRAPCPGCGAPVEFRSAQSTHAVCAYCQSTVVREGEVLKRIGKMAELFDDHSPLQLGASGRYGKQAFTLVGRVQYQYGEGAWSEWHALLADGSSAFLSEDNGAYVWVQSTSVQRELPEASRFRVGATTAINGQSYTVASVQQVTLRAAQGELPRLGTLGSSATVVELRSQNAGERTPGGATLAENVLSLDYFSTPPTVTRGVAVRLEDLHLSGLRETSAQEGKGRQFACPHCGATVNVQLSSTKSMACTSCQALIDLSEGIGGELRHALQDEPVQPLIALGSTGTLQAVVWQVVGYQHRMGYDPQDPDEHFGWDEYLLYNAQRGFTFLVDSTEGWSLVRPATGTPKLESDGSAARFLGKRYALKERYEAETNYVLGEFYWRVQRGQRTSNRDYSDGQYLLSMEQSPQEVTWSVGNRIEADLVVKAFGLQDKAEAITKRDVGPFVAASGPFSSAAFWIFVVFVLIVFAISQCSSCDPRVENCSSSGSGYRTSGGSWGGGSSGGGHK